MTTSNITPGLQGKAVPVDAIKLYEGNPRKGNVEAIAESLKTFGQVKPIVINAEGVIIAGNHTFQAAQQLGWTHIAAVMVEMDEKDAKRFLIADNRTNDLATNDDEQLLSILEGLSDEGLLEGTGYTMDDVDDLIATLERIEETEVQEFEGDYAESPDVTAARWEGRDEGQRREVVFLLEHERWEQFREAVNALKKKYDTDSMADAVYEAVRREAAQTSITVTATGTGLYNGESNA